MYESYGLFCLVLRLGDKHKGMIAKNVPDKLSISLKLQSAKGQRHPARHRPESWDIYTFLRDSNMFIMPIRYSSYRLAPSITPVIVVLIERNTTHFKPAFPPYGSGKTILFFQQAKAIANIEQSNQQ